MQLFDVTAFNMEKRTKADMKGYLFTRSLLPLNLFSSVLPLFKPRQWKYSVVAKKRKDTIWFRMSWVLSKPAMKKATCDQTHLCRGPTYRKYRTYFDGNGTGYHSAVANVNLWDENVPVLLFIFVSERSFIEIESDIHHL